MAGFSSFWSDKGRGSLVLFGKKIKGRRGTRLGGEVCVGGGGKL